MKNNLPKWSTVLSLLLLLSLMAFQKKEEVKVTKEMLIQKALTNKIANFTKTVNESCRSRVLERATAVVDSTLIARAKAMRNTIEKPPKPERPERPEFRNPIDSLPVKSLLKKDSI